MKLSEVFGGFTRPDFVSWLMTDKGQVHIDEVFAPADTEVTAISAADSKLGRCVWMAKGVYSRRFDRAVMDVIFDEESSTLDRYFNPKFETIGEFVENTPITFKWSDVDINEFLIETGLWKG